MHCTTHIILASLHPKLVDLRSNILSGPGSGSGGSGSAKSGVAPGPGPGPPLLTNPPKTRNAAKAKAKTVSQSADAMQKKGAVKVTEADNLPGFLKNSGVWLGSILSARVLELIH